MDDEAGDLPEFDFQVMPGEDGERLDALVSRYLKEEWEESDEPAPVVPSRSKVAQWISDGFVRVNFKTVIKTAYRPEVGALVSVSVPPPRLLSIEPDSSVALDIIYEDEQLLVLNKPAGVVVHPGAGHEEKTLVHGLLAHLGTNLRQVGDALRPGIVHRLDGGTSGVMVVAKTDQAYQSLVKQFVPPRTISRSYLALTLRLPQGAVKGALSGSIDLPIGRHPRDRKKMSVVSTGREALTEWRQLEALTHGFLLELSLHTGRTHQIRVHLQQVNAPLVGDPVYGASLQPLACSLQEAAKKFARPALHAQHLSFVHPTSKETVHFSALVPDDLQQLIRCFR